MAQRDWTQGIGFLYVNPKQLLEQYKKVNINTEQDEHSIQEVNFAIQEEKRNREFIEKHTNSHSNKPLSVNDTKKEEDKNASVQSIKNNLDRLQKLHHKLHAVLAELNQITQSDQSANKNKKGDNNK